jgi:hypothetical protein
VKLKGSSYYYVNEIKLGPVNLGQGMIKTINTNRTTMAERRETKKKRKKKMNWQIRESWNPR